MGEKLIAISVALCGGAFAIFLLAAAYAMVATAVPQRPCAEQKE